MQDPTKPRPLKGGDFARQVYLSRVRYIDAAIGRLVALLKSKSMYASTLLVFTADNGGPLGTANNYPLKVC
jgi:arylsulfatase A-like enzyme